MKKSMAKRKYSAPERKAKGKWLSSNIMLKERNESKHHRKWLLAFWLMA